MSEEKQEVKDSPEIPVEAVEPSDPVEEHREEIDLNTLFPDSETDLNTLFEDEEIKHLLKSVSRNKKDLSRMTERFRDENNLEEEESEEPEEQQED